ncbi:hypothetical protein AXG93_2035s1710 [Marchantia polymorpha subsp. ruderalis]|uniref:SAP domain-containing protein n=1 Tax=Marchantia polymorpha subsp. ruderalis TaxID=1480154 RepID=A0A176VQ50_MARPO|nr:hypothetical protein AXG93_2035s1710 [Marchantia polymorpha subsp. ruderalis]
MASQSLVAATGVVCGGCVAQQLALTKASFSFAGASQTVSRSFGARLRHSIGISRPWISKRDGSNPYHRGLQVWAEGKTDGASTSTEMKNPQTIEEAISQVINQFLQSVRHGFESGDAHAEVDVVFGNGEIVSRRIGEADNEQDPVGLMYPTSKSVAAIIFPIAETLKQVRSLAEKERAPLLIVNPQWRSSGQVVSDFGFGPWRRQAEEFVNTFEKTYVLLEMRVGEASNIVSGTGGVVRILKCYPRNWEVYLMAWDGTSELIADTPTQPAYKELEQIVTEARKRIPWKAPPRILGGSEPAPPPLPASLSGALSVEQIDEMDVTAVRRALMALGLPSSGRLSTLKERLIEAQKK